MKVTFLLVTLYVPVLTNLMIESLSDTPWPLLYPTLLPLVYEIPVLNVGLFVSP